MTDQSPSVPWHAARARFDDESPSVRARLSARQAADIAVAAGPSMSPEAMGLSVDRNTFDSIKSRYDAGGPKQRARLIAAGGLVGKIARRIDDAYLKTDARRNPGIQAQGDWLEHRIPFNTMIGMDPKATTQKAVRNIDFFPEVKQGQARSEVSFDDLIPKPPANPSQTYAATAPLTIAAGPAGGLKPSSSTPPNPPEPPPVPFAGLRRLFGVQAPADKPKPARSLLPHAAVENARLGGGLKPEEFQGILNALELGAFANPKAVRYKLAPVLTQSGREAVEQAMLTAKLRAQHRGSSVLPLPDGGRAFVQGAVDAVSMGLARPQAKSTGNAETDRVLYAASRAQELDALQLKEEYPLAELSGQIAGSVLLGGGLSRALRIPAEITVGGKTFDPRPFLARREATERSLLDRGFPRKTASIAAAQAEKEAVAKAGINWKQYREFWYDQDGKLGNAESEHAPPNLDPPPYASGRHVLEEIGPDENTAALRLGEQSTNTASAAPGMSQTGGEAALNGRGQLGIQGEAASERAENTLNGLAVNPLFRDAISQFKNTTLTNAGRALTKHPEVIGATKYTLNQSLRTYTELNSAAAGALENIIRNGVRTSSIHPRYGDIVTYQIKNGFGARFNAATNKFIGFINP